MGIIEIFYLAAATLGLLLGLTNCDILGEDDITSVVVVLLESILGNGLESLLDVDGLLCRSLEGGDVALRVAPGLETLGGDDTLVLEIDLVADDDEGEVVGVMRGSLDEELVSPAVEVLEGLGDVDVEDEDAAVSATVEGNTETLETLLTGSIPDLHGDDAVVDHDLLCEEISTDGGLVLVGELLVDVLVHERGLADTAVTEDDNLQKNLSSCRHCLKKCVLFALIAFIYIRV